MGCLLCSAQRQRRGNDHAQRQEALFDDVIGCHYVMARWPTGLRRCGHRLEQHCGRDRGRWQTAPRRGLPRGGGRPDGRLRRRQRHYQALSPTRVPLQAAPGASVEAAVAAANRATLAALAPGQQAPIDQAYQAALATLPDGPAKTAGSRWGQTATAILALCAGDGFDTPESYRPQTTPGVYVPTVLPDIAHMARSQALAAGQRRPVPPGTAAEPHQRRVGARLQ